MVAGAVTWLNVVSRVSRSRWRKMRRQKVDALRYQTSAVKENERT